MDDLEQWIADREVIARSQDCGQDLEQCEVRNSTLIYLKKTENLELFHVINLYSFVVTFRPVFLFANVNSLQFPPLFKIFSC